MEDNKNIETRAAETILQQPMEFVVGGTAYKVAPPSLATLILVSEEIAKMPSDRIDPDDMVFGTIARAGDYRPVADTLAILILGAKGLTGTRRCEKKCLFGLVSRVKEETVDRKAELSRKILTECTPSELYKMLVQILKRMEITDFFALTVSLTAVNLLRRTKETVTTVSGR